MNLGTTDQEEWQKDAYWGGPKWGEMYFNKKDPRIIVQKRTKWMGWTVNLSHTAGVLLFVGALFGIPCIVIAIILITGAK